MGAKSGPSNPNWKGGRTIDPRGYVLVRVGKGHPLSDVRGYAYEHRLIAQRTTAKPLTSRDMVRHDNRKIGDNSDGNLTVTDRAGLGLVRRLPHGKVKRMPGEKNRPAKCACGCGASFPFYDRHGRPRRFVSGHNTRGRNDGR